MKGTDQPEERERVRQRIGAALKAYLVTKVGREVHADELRRHVEAVVGVVAPGSADRILRDLRVRGEVEYTCTSRRKSLYRVDRVDDVRAGTTAELFGSAVSATTSAS